MSSLRLILLLAFVILCGITANAEFVSGELKARNYYYKKIHTGDDGKIPTVAITTSGVVNIFGLTPDDFTKYKSKQAFHPVRAMTKFSVQSYSEQLPADLKDVYIVVENRDFEKAVKFTVNIVKEGEVAKTLATDDSANTQSDSDVTVSQETDVSLYSAQTQASQPLLPHIKPHHLYQLALCSWGSRYAFPLCHHFVKNTLNYEGYDTLAADTESAAITAVDPAATPAASTTSDPKAIIVNVSGSDTTIFAIILAVIILMWLTLLVLILRLGGSPFKQVETGRAYNQLSTSN